MPSGSGGQLAIFQVGSLYTDIQSAFAANSYDLSKMWTNFVSANVEHTIADLQEGSITGYKAAPPSHKGLEHGAGDIQVEPNPNALGNFLKAKFGQSNGTVLTEAGSWGANSGGVLNLPSGYGTGARAVVRHKFVPMQTAYEDRCFLPPYGLMIYKDVGSAFIHGGVIIPGMEISIQANQLVKATFNIMSRVVQRASRPSSVSALRNPGGRPWVWDMASIQVGYGPNSLASFDKFESLSIKFETPMEGVVLLDGTKRYGEFQPNGFHAVNISGNMSFRDQTEYDAFVAYENRFLRFALSNTASSQIIGNPSSVFYYSLEGDIPQMKFLTWTTPIQGPNRLTSQFTARGEFDTSSLYQIELRLTNTTSAY